MSDEMNDLKEAFLVEAGELLNQAEEALLSLEKGGVFSDHYNSIFRALHSIKGGAGMLGMESIQNLLHGAESRFQTFNGAKTIASEEINYFLNVIDNTRNLLVGKPVALIPLPNASTSGSAPISSVKGRPRAASIASHNKDKLRAVVIDDEEMLVETLCGMLETDGFFVRGFTSPKQAMEEIQKIDPDVVLSDMKMPGYTGIDVIRHLNTFKKHYPVVFISGYLDKDKLIEAVNQGAEGVIEKPFDAEYVSVLVTRVAKKSRIAGLFEQTLNLMLYQYSDFDEYLKNSGRESVRKVVEGELKTLLEQRRLLRELSKR